MTSKQKLRKWKQWVCRNSEEENLDVKRRCEERDPILRDSEETAGAYCKANHYVLLSWFPQCPIPSTTHQLRGHAWQSIDATRSPVLWEKFLSPTLTITAKSKGTSGSLWINTSHSPTSHCPIRQRNKVWRDSYTQGYIQGTEILRLYN